MHTKGTGVPQDHVEAARWCRLAADQGNFDAQYNHALMYYTGTGVPQDRGKAALLIDFVVRQHCKGSTRSTVYDMMLYLELLASKS